MAPRTLLCCLGTVLVLVLAGCGSEDEAAAPAEPRAATQLTVRVDPDGKGAKPAREAGLRCPDPGADRACEAAASLRPADLEAPDGTIACIELYGGPQTATITGTLNRREVDARFSRTDGCEIARWDKVAPLLEAAG